MAKRYATEDSSSSSYSSGSEYFASDSASDDTSDSRPTSGSSSTSRIVRSNHQSLIVPRRDPLGSCLSRKKVITEKSLPTKQCKQASEYSSTILRPSYGVKIIPPDKDVVPTADASVRILFTCQHQSQSSVVSPEGSSEAESDHIQNHHLVGAEVRDVTPDNRDVFAEYPRDVAQSSALDWFKPRCYKEGRSKNGNIPCDENNAIGSPLQLIDRALPIEVPSSNSEIATLPAPVVDPTPVVPASGMPIASQQPEQLAQEPQVGPPSDDIFSPFRGLVDDSFLDHYDENADLREGWLESPAVDPGPSHQPASQPPPVAELESFIYQPSFSYPHQLTSAQEYRVVRCDQGSYTFGDLLYWIWCVNITSVLGKLMPRTVFKTAVAATAYINNNIGPAWSLDQKYMISQQDRIVTLLRYVFLPLGDGSIQLDYRLPMGWLAPHIVLPSYNSCDNFTNFLHPHTSKLLAHFVRNFDINMRVFREAGYTIEHVVIENSRVYATLTHPELEWGLIRYPLVHQAETQVVLVDSDIHVMTSVRKYSSRSYIEFAIGLDGACEIVTTFAVENCTALRPVVIAANVEDNCVYPTGLLMRNLTKTLTSVDNLVCARLF